MTAAASTGKRATRCIVENGCVHQHLNDDPDDEAIVLVAKAKPLFLFMHMIFQKVAELPPKDAESQAQRDTCRRRICEETAA